MQVRELKSFHNKCCRSVQISWSRFYEETLIQMCYQWWRWTPFIRKKPNSYCTSLSRKTGWTGQASSRTPRNIWNVSKKDNNEMKTKEVARTRTIDEIIRQGMVAKYFDEPLCRVMICAGIVTNKERVSASCLTSNESWRHRIIKCRVPWAWLVVSGS